MFGDDFYSIKIACKSPDLQEKIGDVKLKASSNELPQPAVRKAKVLLSD